MRERLVVIDDQISPALVQELCGKKIETWRIEDGVCVPDRFPIHTRSHGTVCAALAGEFLPEMELVGISTGGNGGAQVENVCAALEWCLQDGAAVVCMSMGVTCGLDLARMETATRALRQAGCWVFCASSNGGKLTFPAAYPWTVEVKFDSTAREVQQVDPRWGCDVAVGLFQSQVLDKLAEEEPFFHARTNSLAVAMAASQVLQAGDVEHLPRQEPKAVGPGWEQGFSKLGKACGAAAPQPGEVGSTAGGVFTAKLLAGAAVGPGGDGLVQDGGPGPLPGGGRRSAPPVGGNGDPVFGSARGKSRRLGLSAGSGPDGAKGGLPRGAGILWRGGVGCETRNGMPKPSSGITMALHLFHPYRALDCFLASFR